MRQLEGFDKKRRFPQVTRITWPNGVVCARIEPEVFGAVPVRRRWCSAAVEIDWRASEGDHEPGSGGNADVPLLASVLAWLVAELAV